MKKRGVLSLFLTLIVITAACINPSQSQMSTNPPEETMVIHFINVGLGDSELIQFPSGKTMLIDAGESAKGPIVADYLKKQGIGRLDLVVASNPSNTNIGGMGTILREFPVEEYIDNGDASNPEPYYTDLHEFIEQENIPYRIVRNGDTISPDPHVSVTVLNPPSTLFNSFDKNSIVLKIVYNNSSALFMGDISDKDEMRIADLAGFTDILKVGYWGNSLTCSQEFLNKVQPEISVLEVLETPSYFLPSKETIARLEQSGSVVYRTDLNGTIKVVTDGNTHTVTTER